MAHTIKDVARLAGVGIATVSRVINGSPNVLPRTRERVLAAIEELGYRPNQAARQLVTARTNTIGVVLPFLTRPFFVEVLRGIEAEVAQANYQLIIFNVESVEQRDRYFGHLPFLGRLDGLIVLSLPLGAAELDRLSKVDLPVVLIDTEAHNLPAVVIDNETAAQMAVEHLIEHGHQRIGYICGPLYPELGISVNRERLIGYEAALRTHNIEICQDYIRASGDGREVGRASTKALLNLATPPTAIFAASDEQAFGAMDEIQARGMQVGQDIAVVGFDDLEMSSYLQLTTVHQPMERMGRSGARILLDRLSNPDQPAPRRTVIPVELCVRQSSVPKS